MKRNFLCLFFLFLTCCLSANPSFNVRVWQFHDDDWEYLKEAIPKAAAYGATSIQLSHSIVMRVDDVLASEAKIELIKKIIDLAHSLELKVDLWSHELTHLPSDRSIGLWLNQKYSKLFERIPGIDGIVLTLAETDIPVYKVKITNDLPEVRLSHLINDLLAVTKKYGKSLTVRTFVYEPDEVVIIGKSIDILAKNHGPHELTFMSKCVPHDWSPYYPYNSLLEKSIPFDQIIEIDLGEEFTGQNKLLRTEEEYLANVLNFAKINNINGACIRVDRLKNHALNSVNEFNLYFFDKLTQDSSKKNLLEEWIKNQFGENPFLARALKRTYLITNLLYFPLQQWLCHHSQLPTWDYAFKSLDRRSLAKWIISPYYTGVKINLLQPTDITVSQLENEKSFAQKLLDESLKDLELAKASLSSSVYKKLLDQFQFLQEHLKLFSFHQLTLFSIKQYRDTGNNKELAEHYFNQFSNQAKKMLVLYGKDSFLADASLIQKVTSEFEEKLNH